MHFRFIAALFTLATLTLAACNTMACNTMEGLGQDIERGGEKLQDSADKEKD
jgi:predicted small secreted protein